MPRYLLCFFNQNLLKSHLKKRYFLIKTSRAVHDVLHYFKGGSQLKLTFVEAEGQGKVVPKYGLYFKGKEGSFSYIRPYVVYT